jgi:hypothetical protein
VAPVVLKLNQTVETTEPTIEIDVGMEPGRHRFQVEVFDQAGNRSVPAVVIVEIQRSTVEPVRPVDPLGGLVQPVDSPVRPGPVIGPRDTTAAPTEASRRPAAAPRATRSRKPRRSRRKDRS